MRGLLVVLMGVVASACGPAPPCCGPPPSIDCCRPPEINATVALSSIEFQCPDAVCGFVNEELDPAPCGCTWTGQYNLEWQDKRISQCFYTDEEEGEQIIRSTIRWWTRGCMGHVDIIIRVLLQPDMRDVFVSYPTFEYTKQIGLHSGYVALARSGSEDDIPQAEKSDMFFEVIMDEPEIGVHMEITECDVDILDSGSADSIVLTTYENISFNVTYADPNGERAEYKAFMDTLYYSPFQRVRCVYAMFNGTTTIDTFTHSKSYMLVNPFDDGIITS